MAATIEAPPPHPPPRQLPLSSRRGWIANRRTATWPSAGPWSLGRADRLVRDHERPAEGGVRRPGARPGHAASPSRATCRSPPANCRRSSTTYGGTRAAQEAVITLNQVRLVNGQHELAAVGLQDFLKGGHPSRSSGRRPTACWAGPWRTPSGRRRRPQPTGRPRGGRRRLPEGRLPAGRRPGLPRRPGSRTKAIETYRRIVKDFPESTSQDRGRGPAGRADSAPCS